ncbi:MAG TPA: hypothetical protein EYN66_12490 [Myxococcales bacterium]|nr:hypothetical protein [Myxococcales bacterium]
MKRAPDQVIVHRIEFQQHEREMLELATASYAVKNVVGPFLTSFTTLFTDEGFLVFLTLALESLGVTDWFPDDFNQWYLEFGVASWNQFWEAAEAATHPTESQIAQGIEAVPSWKIEAGRLWWVASAVLSGIRSQV